MKFLLETEELKPMSSPIEVKFYDAEFALVVFMTDGKFIKKLVPKPLKPAAMPLASAFIAKYPRTNFGCVYNEAALFLHVEYDGIEGTYCLSMPVTEDMALIAGREIFGFPKKIADAITLDASGTGLEAKCVRKGVDLMNISMKFEREVDKTEFLKLLHSFTPNQPLAEEWDIVSYLFKYFPAPDGANFEFKPRLVKQITTFDPISKIKLCSKFSLKLGSSDRDFLGEIPVKNPLFGCYAVYNTVMHPGEVILEVDADKFKPYAFSKIDFWPQSELKIEAKH